MQHKIATVFSFQDMIASLGRAIDSFPDKRTGTNTSYSMTDAGAGAFSIFFTQEPSFLSFQERMQERFGLNNARTLFGIKNIPSDNHIRDLLDPVSPDVLDSVFTDCFNALSRSGDLEGFAPVSERTIF